MVCLDAVTDREALEKYFSIILLKSTLKENDLMNKPGQIRVYNVDKSGVTLDHWLPYVLTKKGQKRSGVLSRNKGQITVVGCINASGQAITPFIVFDARNLEL